RRWMILFVTAASIAAGLVYLRLATPIYTASSRIYLQQVGPQVLGKEDAQTPLRSSETYFYTQCEVIKSQPILADATKDLDVNRSSRRKPTSCWISSARTQRCLSRTDRRPRGTSSSSGWPTCTTRSPAPRWPGWRRRTATTSPRRGSTNRT